jgi:MoxR-vWA-beta-propeller ternary system domain bpX2
MAEDAPNNIIYYLVVKAENRDTLAHIRHWNNLKMGTDGYEIWVKDIDYVQINSLEVKSLPSKTIYYERSGKLYLLNSLLPARNIPSVLWTAIDRALPIQLPPTNNNYFGTTEKIVLNIIPSETEQEAEGMLATIETLQQYIETAPEVRLKRLKWVIIDGDSVFLIGKPLLPISGDVYWRKEDFMMPTGYNFDLHALMENLNTVINPRNDHWIVWQTDNTYFKIRKEDFMPLSLSSFRKSMKELDELLNVD